MLQKELIETEALLVQKSNESELALLKDRIGGLLATNAKLKQEVIELKSSTSSQSPVIKKVSPQTREKTTGAFSPYTLTVEEANQLTEETKIASIVASNGLIILKTTPLLKMQEGKNVQLVKELNVFAIVKIAEINGPHTIVNLSLIHI